MYFRSPLNFVETVPLPTALLEIRCTPTGVVQAFPHSHDQFLMSCIQKTASPAAFVLSFICSWLAVGAS